jgi:hypothetical protein
MPAPTRLLLSALPLAALAGPAAARSYVDPRPPPPPAEAADETHESTETDEDIELHRRVPTRPDEPWRPVDYLTERWRLSGGIGVRFGSFLVDNAGVGTVIPGHLAGGLRKGRLWLFAEYSFLSLTLPEDEQIARGITSSGGGGRGLVHRLGGHARWSFSRMGARDAGFDLYVEGGLGTQVIRWDAGGVWTRPDLALGLGMAGWGAGRREHGGFSVGLRVHLAHRSDVGLGPPACGGPCDAPTRPTSFDRSFLFDMTLLFGK